MLFKQNDHQAYLKHLPKEIGRGRARMRAATSVKPTDSTYPTVEERMFHDMTTAGPEGWTRPEWGASPPRDSRGCLIIIDVFF